MRLPLAVRLSTSRAERDVTADVRDIVFRDTAPGGFASAQLSLDRPLHVQPDEIGYYGTLRITDGRHGGVAWEGRLEDPGRGSGPEGQVWELAALGPSAHASDRTVPLVYVDRVLPSTERVLNNAPGGTYSTGEDPGGSGNDALILQFPQGMSVSNTSRIVMRHNAIAGAGMKLARIDYAFDGGIADTNYDVEAIASTDGGTSDVARSQPLSTGGGGSSPKVVGTDWTNGRNTLDLRLIRSAGGATTVADDLHWASIYNFLVFAMRYNKDGSQKTSGYSSSTLLASDVVADLLGRLLSEYDGANASIATTSYNIDQFSFPDGISPAGVLEELMLLEPAYYWAAWESNSAGKYRFEWKTWPTTVRYECDASDGFNSVGSADGLYNSVMVRYRNAAGRLRSTTRTSTVAVLDDAGLTRQGFVDLGDDLGSPSQANQAGDEWLADHATAANAGTLTIARPILDTLTGRMVMPWEIRSGYLIRVRGVLPKVDSLNATDRDGTTVFRIKSKEFRASTCAATLELDSYSRTVARALAALKTKAKGRRR